MPSSSSASSPPSPPHPLSAAHNSGHSPQQQRQHQSLPGRGGLANGSKSSSSQGPSPTASPPRNHAHPLLRHSNVNSAAMVEKIGGQPHHREPYQRHARNVSAVSDISITAMEPLKRDEHAEIRVVLLCDSETERNSVFEAVAKCLQDAQSNVASPQVMQHHWETPHMECLGVDCKYCFRVSANTGPGAGSGDGDAATHNGHGHSHGHSHSHGRYLSSHEGFFRFSIHGTVFRLMLLSKDRQNLLKIYSYDFLMVGMQVKSHAGHLDHDIWEFEWKRLERHSKKAVAPIVLLGYFRDVLKLGHGDLSLRRTVDESRAQVKKAGKKYRAIPRFCDFVTGNSSQLEDLFLDLERLYRFPGFVLQQCAFVNNLTHFAKIIENPNISEEDVHYKDDSECCDNPIMIAAKLRHKDLVSSVLRAPRFQSEEGNDFLAQLIHARNRNDQTLLAMVALQGPELEEQKLLILQKEIQLHCVSEITHEADQLKLQRCLRSQLKSSAEAAIILEQSRALQGIPKTERELKAERGKVWSRLFFASLLLSLIFQAVDSGSDILIMIRYYGEMLGDAVTSNNTCGANEMEQIMEAEAPNCNVSSNVDISIQCFPQALSPLQKFGYTLFFILVPWPFFIYEFFTSRQYVQLVQRGREIVAEISECRGVASLAKSYLKAIIYSITFVSCFLFWPIAVLFIKYYNDGKYYLAKGAQRAEREKKIEASEVLYSTARVMEVSLESSFQPTIQLYILFPVLMRTVTASSFSLRIFTVCKNESLNLPMLKTDQTISIVTSILSLAWCFTTYHATLKRGALDKDLAALFYRVVLFLSVLFQIVGRLFIFVLFSYSFGPGMYFPILIFLAAHILLMTVLHFIFSDAKMYWDKGGFLNLSFFHYMIGNGLANIYIHNWIRMDPLLIASAKPLQHVSTLMRQFVFDIVFALENVVLLAIALNSNIKELRENQLSFTIVLLGFTLLGVILKCVYYRYLHIWAWLIMDYITKTEDGHWKCIIFSNMFLCGHLRERELLLCCVPRPFFRCLNALFGERYFSVTGTSCSWCAALFSVVLVPVALVVGLVCLAVLVALCLLFSPVFVTVVLPCVLFLKCRRISQNKNVVKIVNASDSRHEGFPLEEQLLPVAPVAADANADQSRSRSSSPAAPTTDGASSSHSAEGGRPADVEEGGGKAKKKKQAPRKDSEENISIVVTKQTADLILDEKHGTKV